MKLFMVLLIITVLGSLSKAPIQPCSKTLVAKYYYEGKYVNKIEFKEKTTIAFREAPKYFIGIDKKFLADSFIVYMK